MATTVHAHTPFGTLIADVDTGIDLRRTPHRRHERPAIDVSEFFTGAQFFVDDGELPDAATKAFVAGFEFAKNLVYAYLGEPTDETAPEQPVDNPGLLAPAVSLTPNVGGASGATGINPDGEATGRPAAETGGVLPGEPTTPVVEGAEVSPVIDAAGEEIAQGDLPVQPTAETAPEQPVYPSSIDQGEAPGTDLVPVETEPSYVDLSPSSTELPEHDVSDL